MREKGRKHSLPAIFISFEYFVNNFFIPILDLLQTPEMNRPV